MTIESIAPISFESIGVDFSPRNVVTPSFFERIQSEVESVNNALVAAEGQLKDLAAGKQNNLHHVMLSMEEARLSFQLLVQVRNKVLDAYQDLLRMQV